MKKSVMKKWVKALRSNNYRQTDGTLKEPGKGYCCLGVLCNISNLGEWEGDEFSQEYRTKGKASSGVLPPAVRKWAGLKTLNGRFSKSLLENQDNISLSHTNSLVELNDSEGWGFKRIASFIEKNYKKL